MMSSMISLKKHSGRSCGGFTLIELMIATLISLICLASAMSAGAALNKFNLDQQEVSWARAMP